MSYNIGLNVVEVDGRVAPSIQAAPTSVAGFVIRAQRGRAQRDLPNQVVQVTNWSQFAEHFGSYVEGAYGAYAVRGFFDNGGAMAYVTRVVNTEPGEATVASMTSNEGPWPLSPDSKLIVNTNLSETALEVEFTASGATLVGLVGPFNLEGDEGGKRISLNVNGVLRGPYQFVADDFPTGGLAEATASEVAAVLNREFSGVQVWVDSTDNLLRVRTDHQGTGASLAAAEVAEDDLGAATDLGFDDSEVTGNGNVVDIDAVTPAEATSLINDVLAPAGLIVTQDGQQVKIEHPNTGTDQTIQVAPASAPTDDIFGFDNEVHSGTGGDAAVAAVASTREFPDAGENPALTVTAGYRRWEDPGTWGDNIAIRITNLAETETYDLQVRYNGSIVETWEKLNNSVEPEADGDHPKDVINDEFTGSKYILVTEESTTNPATTSLDTHDDADEDGFVPLKGGGDGAFAGDAELNAFADSFDLFKLHEIQLLCCPETHEDIVVRAGIDHCQKQGDRMFVGHTPWGFEFGNAKGYAQDFRGDKVYGALYFPWIRVRDPIGNQKWIPPTGHVLGVYARTERERGIWKAPAGNAARLNGALDVEKHITNTDHTDLVKNGNVNAVRFIPGQGIVIDSSRSLSTSPLWLYVNIRLLFNFVKSSLKSGLRWVVQEPNDDTLWNKVKYNSVTPFLMGLWRRGAFGPGSPEDVFTVKCDAENNSSADIQQGKLTIEVYFYPSRPAETIVIIVGQQEGGATASEG